MSSLPSQNRQIVLRDRPTGEVDSSLEGNGTFERKSAPLQDPSSLADKQVMIKVLYCALEPAMRGWLRDARSYVPPVQIGEVMRSVGLGVVVASKSDKFKKGDYVRATTGWQEYAVVSEKGVEPCPISDGINLLDYLGPLGSSGQTAYWGMLDVGKLKGPGQVVVITGAAGSVGLVCVQIAKLYGATVIAVAGGQEKCNWLKSEFGVAEALDYTAADFNDVYRKTVCKKYGYLDILFDNVGGDILDMSLLCLKPHAKVVLCGAISDYNSRPKGLRNYQALIAMRGSIQGFIVFDYLKRYGEAAQVMTKWIKEGKLKSEFHIAPGGLDGLPEAMKQVYVQGGKKGKLVSKVADA